MGGDETWMRPFLSSTDVTPDMVQPQILLRVVGTDLYASGLYDHDQGKLEAISVYVDGEATQPRWARMTAPVRYVAVPTIAGVEGVEFQSDSPDTDEAKRAA